jgi:enterochelin esterase-like enzyme
MRREVEQRLGARNAAAWSGDDHWTIAYRAEDDSITNVEVIGGIQLPMSRIEGTRLWALALRLPGADSAVISLDLRTRRGGEVRSDTTAIREWRGRNAPPKPREALWVSGTLRSDSLWSDTLDTWRGVTIYLPPGHTRARRIPVVYFADGQIVSSYARIIDPLVESGELPPVALVGMWVSRGSPKGGPATGPGDDLRTIEYHEGVESLPGADSAFVVARYHGHKHFFTEEVRRWAEDSLFVSTERRWRAVHGSSSGGHYALTLGRERPDLYGLVIANSNAGADALSAPARGWTAAANHYVSVGRLEQPSLTRTLTALGDSLARYGIPQVVNIYPSGHDSQVWRESLPRAFAWWLGPRKPGR